jgi:hypothetical protein
MIADLPWVMVVGQGGYSLLGAAFLVGVVFCWTEGRNRHAAFWLWTAAALLCAAAYFFGVAVIASYPSGTLNRNVATVYLRGLGVAGALTAWMAIILRIRILRRYNGGGKP